MIVYVCNGTRAGSTLIYSRERICFACLLASETLAARRLTEQPAAAVSERSSGSRARIEKRRGEESESII